MVSLDQELVKNMNFFNDAASLKTLPKPILVSYRKIESEKNPKVALQELCLSLIPLTFQYFGLLLSSEYLNSENLPNYNVTESLWNMIKRPGPGKWVGFIREAVIYFQENKTIILNQNIINQFHGTLVSKKKPLVTLFDKAGNQINKLDYWNALVNIRNQFAHGRGFTEENSKTYFEDYFLIWKTLVSLSSSIFDVKVLISDYELQNYYSLDDSVLEKIELSPKTTNFRIIIWNRENNSYQRIFPLVIPDFSENKQNGDALFLEEVKGKSLTYLFKDTFIQRKDEYKDLIFLLDKKTEKPNSISSTELTISILGDRIDRVTNKTLTNFEDTKKYIPQMFISRPSIEESLNNWLKSDKSGCILLGKPGTGKTSLVANWCKNKKEEGNHVLLLESSKLGKSDLSTVIKERLSLASSLADCFSSVFNQIKNEKLEERKSFIIVVDAINEFIGNEMDNRGLLWREVNSLIDKLDDYTPYFKCLVTSRSDLWKTDFPKKDSAEHTLKNRLFYAEDSGLINFPHLFIGNLSEKESELVYEKSRLNLPGMSPLTTYQNLPFQTKHIIANPFLLRLTLQTFNNQEVPSLTKRELDSRFAKEKALKEKNKVEILFKLLERMSEFNKAEISFDDFIFGKEQKGKKKSKEDGNDLAKIIYDPRINRPYKELLNDGLLEEHTKNDNNEIIETISFAQEKISDIIGVESRKNNIHKMLNFWKYLFIPCLLIVLLPLIIKPFSRTLIINSIAQVYSIIAEITSQSNLYTEVKNFINLYLDITVTRFSILLLIIISFGFLFTIVSKYVDLLAFKLVSRDLSSKFMKAKLTSIHRNLMGKIINPIAFIGIVFYVLIRITYNLKTPLQDKEYFFAQLLDSLIQAFIVAVLFMAIGNILLEVYVTIKHSMNNSNAFILFGPKETLNDSITSFFGLLTVLILVFAVPKALDLIDFSKNEELVIKYEQFISQQDFVNLKKIRPDIAEFIEGKIFNPVEERENISKLKFIITKFLNAAILVVLVYIIVHLLLTYLIAFPLEKYLRKKLNST